MVEMIERWFRDGVPKLVSVEVGDNIVLARVTIYPGDTGFNDAVIAALDRENLIDTNDEYRKALQTIERLAQ